MSISSEENRIDPSSRQPSRNTWITLSPGLVVRVMVVCVVALHILSDVGFVLNRFGLIGSSIANAITIHGETTVPAWYSSMTLFGCAVLLTVIAVSRRRAGDRFAMHWVMLAITFLVLSMDESAALHELSISRLQGLFGTSPLLKRAWVVPGAAAALVFGLAYLPFLRHLGSRTRRLFVASGVIFVTGAVGMEMVGSLFDSNIVAYKLCVHVEEGMEMFGVIVFTYALLLYLQRHVGEVRIRIA